MTKSFHHTSLLCVILFVAGFFLFFRLGALPLADPDEPRYAESAREMIEHALAHQLKDKAEAAYSRSTMPERRRELMDAWAEYCGGSSPTAKS